MKGGPSQATNSNAQVQGKKTRQPNWDHGKILALVKAKRRTCCKPQHNRWYKQV